VSRWWDKKPTLFFYCLPLCVCALKDKADAAVRPRDVCVVFCRSRCASAVMNTLRLSFLRAGREGTLGQCEIPKDPRYPDCTSKMDVSLLTESHLRPKCFSHKGDISSSSGTRLGATYILYYKTRGCIKAPLWRTA